MPMLRTKLAGLTAMIPKLQCLLDFTSMFAICLAIHCAKCLAGGEWVG